MQNLETLVNLFIGIATLGATFGIVKSNLDRVKQDILRLENHLEQFREIYVTYQHFQVVVQAIRDDHKELKEDVKEILRIVNERHT